MPAKIFTDQFVKSAAPGNYSATNCSGLSLRVTDNVKSFRMVYRSKITGKVETVTLGRYPDVTLATAKQWVDEARARNANDKPVGEFTTAKKNERTVDDVLALYKTNKLDDLKSGPQMHQSLATIVAREKWGALPFTMLTKTVLLDACRRIKNERKKRASAGKAQVLLSTWMKWSAGEDYCPFNPIAGMTNVAGKATRRQRFLDADEIRALWTACHAPGAHGLHPTYADALLLILTTAARSGMVCGLLNGELFGFANQPAAERRGVGAVADFPASRMKKGREFVLPLNSLALEIIARRLRATNGTLVFPTASVEFKDKGKSLRRRRLSAVANELSVRLGFKTPFTPHDLRRTGSKLLRQYYTRDQVGALLSHEAEGGAAMKHYDPDDRWDHLDQKRALSDRLAEMLKEIVSSSASVTEIRRAA